MPGEIKPGDHMWIVGLASRPEYNNRVGLVVGAVANGRFEVKLGGVGNSIAIASEKLIHIRPVM